MKIYMNDDEIMDKSIKNNDMPQSLLESLSKLPVTFPHPSFDRSVMLPSMNYG